MAQGHMTNGLRNALVSCSYHQYCVVFKQILQKQNRYFLILMQMIALINSGAQRYEIHFGETKL